jgi:hypothetical protein
MLALGALVAAGVGAGLWLALRVDAPPPAPPAPPAIAQAEPEAAPSAAPLGDGPPLDAAGARGALEGVSADPLFRSWLAHGDLVRRWIVVTANLAAGESPRRVLPFLAPRAPFTATAHGDRLVISPESYARYDAFADAVGSVDPAALAAVYRRLHGPLEAAHRALGLSAGSLDALTGKALRRIAGAPVRDGDVEVRVHEGQYELVDPRLEELGEVEKHLLRMGPRNTRILQAKARAILEALRLPVVASQRP